MKLLKLVLASGLALTLIAGCGAAKKDGQLISTVHFKEGTAEKEFDKFYASYISEMEPAYREDNLAYFNASINNTKENWDIFAEKDKRMNAILSNKAKFDTVKAFKISREITNPLKKRQIEVLYNEFMAYQINPTESNKLTDMNAAIEGKYSAFRAKVDGKQMSDNEVENVLLTSKNDNELKQVWLAQKELGRLVSADIIALVKQRNKIAHELGYENWHTMSLVRNEQDPKDIEKLFDELDKLTAPAFAREKARMDSVLAMQLGIKKQDLMPWHYQNRFFQEAPNIYSTDLDKYFANKNIIDIVKEYYRSLGLPIDEMVANSDLYEKPGKNQHAYCINIDRNAKDIRVLCNIKNNDYWLSTLLHEFGHALYEKHYAEDLPWNLKNAACIFTTEGVAMMFERFTSSPKWLVEVAGIPQADADLLSENLHKTLVLKQLVFSRFVQVMYRFEKSMYANPDQDLNKLWWDLVEKYQLLKKPVGRNEPDWATKIHIATSPCYYHNYLMGELFASQLHYSLAKSIGCSGDDDLSFKGQKAIGKFMIDKVFAPGMRYKWNDMIKKATGEKLTPKYYAKQFVN